MTCFTRTQKQTLELSGRNKWMEDESEKAVTRKINPNEQITMNFQELNSKLGGKEAESDWKQSLGGGWMHKSAIIFDETRIMDDAIVWGKVSDGAMIYGAARVGAAAEVSGAAQVIGSAEVAGTAIVSDNAFISGSSRIVGNARIWGNASVFGDALVTGNSIISDAVQICNNARIGDNARIRDNARIGGDAQILGNAYVFDTARITGNAMISGAARICGDARIGGDARIFGDAQICGDVWKKSPLFLVGSRYSLTNGRRGYIQIGYQCQPFQWWIENVLNFAKENKFSDAEIAEYTAYIQLFCKIGK